MSVVKEKYLFIEQEGEKVVGQQQALKIYLDSMLLDITDLNKHDLEKPELKENTESNKSILQSKLENENRNFHDAHTPIIPEYAKNDFTVLSFKVAGMTLAVPLTEVGSVELLPANLKSVVGKPQWISGVVEYKTGSAYIVDTYELVIPKTTFDKRPKPKRDATTRVVLSANGQWGLICEEVGDTFVLKAQEVCWRTMHTRRSWLAGTVSKYGCVLIDFRKISWYE